MCLRYKLLALKTSRLDTPNHCFILENLPQEIDFSEKYERELKYYWVLYLGLLKELVDSLKNSCCFSIKEDTTSILAQCWNSALWKAIADVVDHWLQLWKFMNILLYIPPALTVAVFYLIFKHKWELCLFWLGSLSVLGSG